MAILLISFGWWENYVDRRSRSMPIKRLAGVKDRLKRTRYFTYMFISYWKMLVFFSCMLLFLYFNGLNPGTLFSDFNRQVAHTNLRLDLPGFFSDSVPRR